MSKSQNKKVQENVKEKTNFLLIGSIAFSVLTIIILFVLLFNNLNNNASLKDNRSTLLKDGDLIIQLSNISNHAKFYPVEVDGTKLEVLAVKAPDGTIRTAFNTC